MPHGPVFQQTSLLSIGQRKLTIFKIEQYEIFVKKNSFRDMITETGANLSILIVTEAGKDWETFGTWYSIFKNLPDATIAIVVERNKEAPFVFFQWTKRLRIPLFHERPMSHIIINNHLDYVRTAQRKKFLGDNILVIDPLVMAIDIFDQKILDLINSNDMFVDSDNNTLFLRNQDIDEVMNQMWLEDKQPFATEFCVEAKETEEAYPLVSYKKGCGKWIDKSKGCPFSSAAGLTTPTMTVNENRVVELWKKMCSLYSAVV